MGTSPRPERKMMTGNNLAAFAVGDWFKDPSRSSVWLRLYTSLFIAHKDFLPALDGALNAIELDAPTAIACGQVDAKIPDCTINVYAGEDGKTIFDGKVEERHIKQSNYVILATPYKVDGTEGNEPTVRKRLSRLSALLTAHMGLNFMRDLVLDGEVHALDGKIEVPGRAIRVPKMCEGPFIAKQNWDDASEIAKGLKAAPQEIRHRIELSLEYFDRAMRVGEDSFFYYWTALEMLCNGKAPKIKARLQKCYDLKNVTVTAQQTGIDKIAQWRHDFFHKGQRPWINFDVERYLQLMFLDLLRHELGLSLRGHIAGMQRATGYDLSPIGLMDNRTPEQKEAARQPSPA